MTGARQINRYLVAPVDRFAYGRLLRSSLVKLNHYLFSLYNKKLQILHDDKLLGRPLVKLFEFISFFGMEEGWSAVFVGLLCCNQVQAVLLGSYTLFLCFIVCNSLKSASCIPRPPSSSSLYYIEKAYDWSFPSNHVFSATAIYLAWVEPGGPGAEYRTSAALIIFLISFARVFLLMHHVTDVVCSLVLGKLVKDISLLTFSTVLDYLKEYHDYISAQPESQFLLKQFGFGIFLLLVGSAIGFVLSQFFPELEPTDTALVDTLCALGIFFGFAHDYFDTDFHAPHGNGEFVGFRKTVAVFMLVLPGALFFGIGFIHKVIPGYLMPPLARAFNLRFYSSSKVRRHEKKMMKNLTQQQFRNGLIIQSDSSTDENTYEVERCLDNVSTDTAIGTMSEPGEDADDESSQERLPNLALNVRRARKSTYRRNKHYKESMKIPGVEDEEPLARLFPLHDLSPYRYPTLSFDLDLPSLFLANYILSYWTLHTILLAKNAIF